MISLITVNYNDSMVTREFVERIVSFEDISHIIVVDNHSSDGSFSILEELGRIYEKVDVIESGKNGGYGYGNNYGIRYAVEKYHSDALLISNPDVFFDNYAVRRMKAVLDTQADAAVAAPVSKDCYGRYCRQAAWRIPKSGWGFIFMDAPLVRYLLRGRYYYKIRDLRSESRIEVDAVSGALLMLRAADVVRAGYYDEELFLYCEESVLAMKLKAIGRRSFLLTNIQYMHHPSTTILKSYRTFLQRMQLLWKSKEIVLKKYYGFHGLRLVVFYIARKFCYVYAWVRGLLA